MPYKSWVIHDYCYDQCYFFTETSSDHNLSMENSTTGLFHPEIENSDNLANNDSVHGDLGSQNAKGNMKLISFY